MIGETNLKKYYFEALGNIDESGSLDTLIVRVYQFFSDKYNNFTKDNAKEIALCLVYKYGCLYK